MRRLGIYIHIPFCVKKCLYCDFLSFPAPEEEKKEYVQALLAEIGREAVFYTDYIVDSVFFGGGTPTVLPEGAVEGILDCLRQSFCFAGDREAEEEAEITVEINPATADRKKLESLRRAGVNRISIGTQSVHDRELAYLGRVHKAEDFFRIYEDAVASGFTNINVDLMAALPGQTAADYMESLEQVAGLGPAHISAYSLIIEEGTPFYELYGGENAEGKNGAGMPGLGIVGENGGRRGILPLPSEEEEREMYEDTGTFLKERGYYRYEISNYARPGLECRHNIGYWERKDYAGFGLGAASMVDNVRWKNFSDMKRYIRGNLVKKESVREDCVRLSLQEQMEEFMFLGLRLTKGISRRKFRETFGRDVEEVYRPVMEKLHRQGLLELDKGEYIRLTPYGRDVSNYVMAEFLF